MIEAITIFLAIMGLLLLGIIGCLVWLFWGILSGPQYDDEDLKETLWENKDGQR